MKKFNVYDRVRCYEGTGTVLGKYTDSTVGELYIVLLDREVDGQKGILSPESVMEKIDVT